MKNLTHQQILQGIEDVVLKKLKWSAATVVLDRGVVGMIIGVPVFVDMMKSAAEGKSNKPKTDLN